MFSQHKVITRPVFVGTRDVSLNDMHRGVLANFMRNMDCSVDDIDRVVYTISSYKFFISAICVVLIDGTDYLFTYDNPDADGTQEDIAYTTNLYCREIRGSYAYELNSDEEDDYENGIFYRYSYRVHLDKLKYLPKSITKRIGTHKPTSDIVVSLPSKRKSFIKHHKDLVKIDRRRKIPEIYKEWDETIEYYPVTVVNYDYPEELISTTSATETALSLNIAWSDDEW